LSKVIDRRPALADLFKFDRTHLIYKMTDYPDGAGDPKRPEPDRSDATIDSEGPSLSAIAGKYPLVLPTRDARFCIRTVVFQV